MSTPSPRQQKIYDSWVNTDENLLISAVAGSGKTTTLLQLLSLCKYRTLFLAFNKSIQEEIESKIQEKGLKQGKAMTIHSLGLMAIKSKFSFVNINKGKNFEILKEVQNKFKSDFSRYQWKDRFKIGYTLMDFNDTSRLILEDDIKNIIGYFNDNDKYFFEFSHLKKFWKYFLEVRESYMKNNRNIVIDFIDMIYLPVKFDYTIPIHPTYLMIDEAQDLNWCQHRLIDKLIAQPSVEKWIAVGDENQSIYGFSGAASDSFDLFKGKNNVVEYPLDVCYRCKSAIVDSANEVFDVMESYHKDEGIVETIQDISLIKDNSMIICRNSTPLIGLYFELLKEGKNCYIKGEGILNSLIRFLRPYKNKTIYDAEYLMVQEYQKLEQKKDSGLDLYVFKENYNNFLYIMKNLGFGSVTIQHLIEKLSKLFDPKKDSIMLCTIHKSKGLEADVVYILQEDLIPSKFANTPEKIKQEQNLRYVARTRAKNELYFLNYE